MKGHTFFNLFRYGLSCSLNEGRFPNFHLTINNKHTSIQFYFYIAITNRLRFYAMKPWRQPWKLHVGRMESWIDPRLVG